MAMKVLRMNGKKVMLVAIIVSLTFNILFIVSQITTDSESVSWLFPELGPAVVQDSGFGRAPAIESPFNIIGDLPGSYSLYDGNPLQYIDVAPQQHSSGVEVLLLAIAFCVIPLSFVLILGRRSYGASKTQ